MKNCFNKSILILFLFLVYTGIYLERLFGTGFLTPLENTDTVFQLEINHLNLSKYTSMITKSELRDDLDLAVSKYNPKSGHYIISMPNFDEKMFDVKNTSNESNKNEINKQIKIPTRLPSHPGVISILLFNRDNQDNQIKFVSLSKIDEIICKFYAWKPEPNK